MSKLINRVMNRFMEGKRLQEEQNNRLTALNDLIARFGDRAWEEYERSRMSTEELYGDEIDRFSRSVDAAGNRTRSMTQRAGMAGGDSAGVTASQLLNIDEQGSRTKGAGMDRFNMMARDERAGARRAGDHLMGTKAALQGGLLARADARLQHKEQQAQQRRQARRQFFADLLGTGLSAFAL